MMSAVALFALVGTGASAARAADGAGALRLSLSGDVFGWEQTSFGEIGPPAVEVPEDAAAEDGTPPEGAPIDAGVPPEGATP